MSKTYSLNQIIQMVLEENGSKGTISQEAETRQLRRAFYSLLEHIHADKDELKEGGKNLKFEEKEGNIVIFGGNGCGKSSGIAKPTLQTWKGALCVTDIKGELSDFYISLYQQGLTSRPYIIFDPLNPDSVGYDPFSWLLQDDECNTVHNILEIVDAIIPVLPDDKQPFWVECERAVFAAALLYFFQRGYSFSESIEKIMVSTTSKLCAEIIKSNNTQAIMALGGISDMNPEAIAAIDRGIRNKLMFFSTDPYIVNAFRGVREGAPCFSWNDLEKYNIFLRIPESYLGQWSGAINLMYTQLIRFLERRPDMHSSKGKKNIQTLLMLDEFARFGKLSVITNALATLRSKNVNICLFLQSIAQLDLIYGECGRRILLDNCQFKAILRADDSETQRMLSDLIGTQITFQRSFSKNFNVNDHPTGSSKSLSEIREALVQPHELALLNYILLLTPQGLFKANKIQLHDKGIPYPVKKENITYIELTPTPPSQINDSDIIIEVEGTLI